MARTSAIKVKRPKRIKTKKNPSLGFLPQSTQVFVARRLLDIIAGMLFIGGMITILSLISYNHADPSWNSAISSGAAQDTTNWMGGAGAWISDLLLQTLGAGGFIIGLIPAIWGYRLYKRQTLSPLWSRIISSLISAGFASIALAQIPAGSWLIHPYLGSTAGTLMLESIVQWGQNINSNLGHIAFTLIAGIIAVATFLHGANISKRELLIAFHKLKYIVLSTILITFDIGYSIYAWIRHYNNPKFIKSEKSASRLHALELSIFKKITLPKTPKQPLVKIPNIASSTVPHDIPASAIETPSGAKESDIPVVAPQKSSALTAATEAEHQQRFALSDAGEWVLPSLNLIQEPPAEVLDARPDNEALRKNAEMLQNVLADFNIQGEIVSIHPGPVVTLYELEPAPGTKSSRVISLSDDIARSMSAVSVRCAVVAGRNVIGIELPNTNRQIVYMREILASKAYEKTKAALPLVLGKDIGGQPIIADLAKMPHLLVAGTTGSGKSVAINTMLLSLLYALPPEKCRMIMIDPKMLELSVYDDIPHLLSPVVTDPAKAVVALKWAVQEMEDRYRSMSKLGVRNIAGYNERLKKARDKGEVLMNKVQTGFDSGTGKPVYEEQVMDLTELPYIVVIVDEFADLMLVAGKDVENAIQRLAQMARAAGIHLIMATQRPSVDVITGVIKANFPTRISFQVTSKIDSRTILGDGGAEQLLGMGDMLYMAPGGSLTRVHGPFVSDNDVKGVVATLKAQSEPNYIANVTQAVDFGDNDVMNAMFGGDGGSNSVDELYDNAVSLVARERKASTSFVQRHLQIGYNRAARIVEEMERQGVISPASSTGKREVLVSDQSDGEF